MKKLFTNVVMAKASKEQVLTILENPETLLQWVPEVQQPMPSPSTALVPP